MAASSSSIDKTKTMASTSFFPLDDLPVGILVDIFACLADEYAGINSPYTALQELHNIRAVSKKFLSLAYDPKVLKRARLDDDRGEWDGDKWYPILHSLNFQLYESRYDNFVARCITAQNPGALDAIFQLGATQFFVSGECDLELEEKGLKNVKEAVDKGLEGAAEVYGVFLLTLGVERHREGYEILAPFRIELNPTAVQNLQSHWRNIDIRQWWRPTTSREEYIRKTYVRDNCQCDGLTTQWLETPSQDFWQLDHTPPSTMACVVCQWHYAIETAFHFSEWRWLGIF